MSFQGNKQGGGSVTEIRNFSPVADFEFSNCYYFEDEAKDTCRLDARPIARTNAESRNTPNLYHCPSQIERKSEGYKCKVCIVEFPEAHHLDRHYSLMHKREPMSRDEVGPTTSRGNLGDLAESRGKDIPGRGDGSSICHICNKTLSNPHSLRRHQLIHNDIKPFECSRCSQQFRQNQHLIAHTKRCGHKSESNQSRKKTTPIHSPFNSGEQGDGDRDARIEVINPAESIVAIPDSRKIYRKKLDSRSNFSDQSTCKSKRRQPTSCPQRFKPSKATLVSGSSSSETFPTDSVATKIRKSGPILSSSVTKEVNETTEGTTVCPVCTTEFQNKTDLIAHINLAHEIVKPLLEVCDICGLFFPSAPSILAHLLNEHHKKCYCIYCQRSFTTEEEQKEHSSAKESICILCREEFSNQCLLNKHLKCHLI